MAGEAAWRAVERAARESFGRLVAYLAARSGDVTGAQDALADAFAAALARWPADGVPAKPEAWLLSTARRRLLDRHRHSGVAAAAAEPLRLAQEELDSLRDARGFPDERLELMFACGHPAIEPGIRTPLMLQAVLGLDAARIASAFLVSPDAMTKRLTRAKLRLRDARVPFALPAAEDLPSRVADVLAAIYSAFTLGSDDPALDARGEPLAEEAIWLARVAVRLLPTNAEAEGLLALMLFSHARAAARRGLDGAYVPLSRQDTGLWSEPMMAEAEALLRAAGRRRTPGRYQLEAAIQAVHADRRRAGRTEWAEIVQLYDGLAQITPSVGAEVARAAALCEAGDAHAALAALDAIEVRAAAGYQPWWATRAHVLLALGSPADVALALTRAAGLTEDAAVRAHLLAKHAALAP